MEIESVTPAELVALDARHQPWRYERVDFKPGQDAKVAHHIVCAGCMQRWPCEVAKLIATVRQLSAGRAPA